MTVLTVVSAGLRVPSSTRNLADQLAAAARAALHAADSQVDVRVVEIREHAHAITDALLTGFPAGDLRTALRDVSEADALVVVTPTFQGSYSGLFKSFADLLEVDAVRGTPVLLAATGGSERHSLVLEHALRPLFSYLGALTVPTGVYAATSDFGGAGAAGLTERIERAAAELAHLAIPAPAAPAVPGDETTHSAAHPAPQPSRPRLTAVPATSTSIPESAVTPFEELLARTRP